MLCGNKGRRERQLAPCQCNAPAPPLFAESGGAASCLCSRHLQMSTDKATKAPQAVCSACSRSRLGGGTPWNGPECAGCCVLRMASAQTAANTAECRPTKCRSCNLQGFPGKPLGPCEGVKDNKAMLAIQQAVRVSQSAAVKMQTGWAKRNTKRAPGVMMCCLVALESSHIYIAVPAGEESNLAL